MKLCKPIPKPVYSLPWALDVVETFWMSRPKAYGRQTTELVRLYKDSAIIAQKLAENKHIEWYQYKKAVKNAEKIAGRF